MKQLAQRMREPSSWAGIAAILTLAAPHLHLTAEAIDLLVQAGTGVAGLIAIFMPEQNG